MSSRKSSEDSRGRILALRLLLLSFRLLLFHHPSTLAVVKGSPSFFSFSSANPTGYISDADLHHRALDSLHGPDLVKGGISPSFQHRGLPDVLRLVSASQRRVSPLFSTHGGTVPCDDDALTVGNEFLTSFEETTSG